MTGFFLSVPYFSDAGCCRGGACSCSCCTGFCFGYRPTVTFLSVRWPRKPGIPLRSLGETRDVTHGPYDGCRCGQELDGPDSMQMQSERIHTRISVLGPWAGIPVATRRNRVTSQGFGSSSGQESLPTRNPAWTCPFDLRFLNPGTEDSSV